ncbi:hypothetical protein FACS1894167_00210 [Synergistales bacterium]|nr:hypothetical protein FACS1894167_00210 [Synergistales bacterium]
MSKKIGRLTVLSLLGFCVGLIFAVTAFYTAEQRNGVSYARLDISHDILDISHDIDYTSGAVSADGGVSADNTVRRAVKTRAPYRGDKALLAIVLDDCGGNMELAREVRDMKLPLTWAVIPNLRYSRATVSMLKENDIPFLVHFPMQALPDPDGFAGKKSPKGDYRYYYVGVGMSEKEVRDAMIPVLDSMEGAFGLNNHRGSKATEEWAVMRHVMKVLSERGLFFLDSSTTRNSVAYKAALEEELAARKNGHFLDNESNRTKIAKQFDIAVTMAKKRGSLIVICHLRPETVAFLRSLSADGAGRKGIRLVTLPELVKLEGDY